MGPPAKIAWATADQTHRETDTVSKRLKLKTGAFFNFVSIQNSVSQQEEAAV